MMIVRIKYHGNNSPINDVNKSLIGKYPSQGIIIKIQNRVVIIG